MANTLGYHYVKSTYGMWLPGDRRGSWSAAWDDQIGFIQPHTLHEGDPVRRRMAEERMKHAPVRLTEPMMDIIADTFAECVIASAGGLAIAAAAIEPTHVHLLIPYSGRNINNTAKWLADRTTKAIHRKTDHAGPVWCKGKWCTYVFDPSQWENTKEYIECHNTRRGREIRSYTFVHA